MSRRRTLAYSLLLVATSIAAWISIFRPGCTAPDPYHEDEVWLHEPKSVPLRLRDKRTVGKLEIHHWTTPVPELVEWIKSLTSLEELWLVDCVIRDEDLIAMVQAHPELTVLKVYASGVNSSAILALPVLFDLKHLDFRESPGIDDSVVPWIKALPELEELLIMDSSISALKYDELEQHMESRGGKVLLGAWGE